MVGIIFFLFGFIMLIAAFVLEGGALGALAGLTPAMIVFGGVIGATGLTMPAATLKAAISALPTAFKGKKNDPVELINYFSELSSKARKSGLLSLDSETNNEQLDQFIRLGLTQVVDGVHNEELRRTLETEVDVMTERHSARAKVFEAAGGYAPTMGIIGTVMGLVHVLGNLSEPDKLGPLIAAAFLATLYGIASANLIFLPLGGRLKALDEQEVFRKSLIIEGIMSLQHGDSPAILKRKLGTFLETKQKVKLNSEG